MVLRSEGPTRLPVSNRVIVLTCVWLSIKNYNLVIERSDGLTEHTDRQCRWSEADQCCAVLSTDANCTARVHFNRLNEIERNERSWLNWARLQCTRFAYKWSNELTNACLGSQYWALNTSTTQRTEWTLRTWSQTQSETMTRVHTIAK